MTINSKDKGRRGERQVAQILREAGFKDAKRGQQFSAANGDADVIDALPGVWLEVKYRERLNIYEAMEQAQRDAKGIDIPWVVHRKNNKPWLCTMTFEEAILLYRLAGLDDGENK